MYKICSFKKLSDSKGTHHLKPTDSGKKSEIEIIQSWYQTKLNASKHEFHKN